MKCRRDFVTNSSSSSFICEICGRSESGFDISLSDVQMVNCVNDHTICEDEMLPIPRDIFITDILSYQKDHAAYCNEIYTEEELEAMNDTDLLTIYFKMDDARWCIPEECCPICQFIEYSNKDLAAYLEKKYRVSRDEVFADIKKVSKRRKKLYDSEYITEVCKRFNLNPAEVVASLKEQFKTYSAFKGYIK